MIIYPCKELGCYFRLNDRVLESAPMYADGTGNFDEFGERDISDNARFMFQGKIRAIKTIEKIIIGIITELSKQELDNMITVTIELDPNDPLVKALVEETHLWEWCEEHDGAEAYLHEDNQIVTDNCPAKHHYHCEQCGKLTQIG